MTGISGKVCKECWRWRTLQELVKGKKDKHGRKRLCKECQRKQSKKKYKENPDYYKRYREKNREYKAQYMKQWNKKNREYKAQHSKQRYKDNPDYIKQWRADNPDKVRAYRHKRRALKNGTTVGKVDWAVVDARSGPNCYICGMELAGHATHYDHIVPLARGGANITENFALVHAFCNRVKQDKLVEELTDFDRRGPDPMELEVAC